MTLGFIGLGIMGSRMAANLQKAGLELVVSNRTKEKAGALLAGGAVWADTPAAVAGQVDILFTMLGDPPAVAEIAIGHDGFLDQLQPGSLWVDCSTVNPSFSRDMAGAAAQCQVRFLDAPVAGSKAPAAAGQLTFLVGGDVADVAEAKPYFDAMGQRVVHVGEHGMGTSLKIVFNSLLGGAMAAFSESMAMGQALGLPQSVLLDFLLGSPAVPAIVTGKRARLEADAFGDADFPCSGCAKTSIWPRLRLTSMTWPCRLLTLPRRSTRLRFAMGWATRIFRRSTGS